MLPRVVISQALTLRLQPQDYIRADLYRLAKEKFPDMFIASAFAVPRDYYWFPYLGRIDGELINIADIYVPGRTIACSDVADGTEGEEDEPPSSVTPGKRSYS